MAQTASPNIHKCLLDSSRDMFYAVDKNYCYLYFNKAYANDIYKVYGKRIEIGMRIPDVLPDYYSKKCMEHLRSAFNGECILLHKKPPVGVESNVDNEYYIYPLQDEDSDTTIGAGVMITDISDKIQLEKGAKLNASRLLTMSDMMPDFFVISDANRTRLHVNKSYCTFFGKKASELINTPYDPFVPENKRSRYIQHIENITPTNPSVSHLFRMKSPNGSKQWTLWNETGVFDKNGKLLEIISVGRNVDKIIEAENLKAEYIKVLEETVFRTSHEIRQPIANLIGLMDIINRDLVGEKDLKQTLEYISNSIERLDDVTNEMNDFIHKYLDSHKDLKVVTQL